MIRPIGILLSILIISLNLNAQDEKASRKFILGGSIFGNVEKSTRNLGSVFTPIDHLTITVTNTEIGFQPYLLFGTHPKRKFGFGIRNIYNKTNNVPNSPNILESYGESQFLLGLDLLYRHTFLKKGGLTFFAQGSIGSDQTIISSDRTTDDRSAFNIQSEIKFGATFQVAKSWNLLLLLPVMDFRFQNRNSDTSNPPTNININDNRSTIFNLNTSFTNLNLGVEKTF